MGGGARVSEFFFTKTQNLKKIFFWGGGGLGGGCIWMDRRTGPNQFAPSISLKLGE